MCLQPELALFPGRRRNSLAAYIHKFSVFSPGFLHTHVGRGGGGEQGVRIICPCPCAVSVLCAVLLANGEQQTDNGRRSTVVQWNVYTTDNPSSKTRHSRSCACFLLQSHQSSTTPSDAVCLAVSIVNMCLE